LCVRPDGRGFASASADKDVKFWDFTVEAGGVLGIALSRQLTMAQVRRHDVASLARSYTMQCGHLSSFALSHQPPYSGSCYVCVRTRCACVTRPPSPPTSCWWPWACSTALSRSVVLVVDARPTRVNCALPHPPRPSPVHAPRPRAGPHLPSLFSPHLPPRGLLDSGLHRQKVFFDDSLKFFLSLYGHKVSYRHVLASVATLVAT